MNNHSPDPKTARELAVREAKCTLILDAARKVFSEKGYYETRLEDVASSAGFSKASLYNYYPDKEAIFLSLAIREYQELVQTIERQLDPSASFESNLRAAVRGVLTHLGTSLAFLLSTANYESAMQLHIDVCKHPELAAGFARELHRILGVLTRMVAMARERGEVRGSLDDQQIAGFIGSLVRGVLFDWKHAAQVGDIESTVSRLVEFACRGAGVASPGQQRL